MRKSLFVFWILNSILMISAGKSDLPGKITRTIPLAISSPLSLAYDGKSVYLLDKESTKIYKVDITTGRLSEYIVTPGTGPTSITTDGQYLYVLDSEDRAIYKIEISSRETVKRLEIDVESPLSIAYGDGFLYINDLSKKTINKLSTDDATTITTISMPTAGRGRSTEEYGMVYNKDYLYITDRNTDTIYQVYTATGDVINMYNLPELPFMTGIAFIKDELYVADLERKIIARINIKAEKIAYRRNQRSEEVLYKEKYRNMGPDKINEVSIAIAIPSNQPNQDILGIEYSPDKFEKVKDRWGQEFALSKFKDIKAGEEVSSSIKVKTNIYEIRYFIDPDIVGPISTIPEEIREKYLKDDLKYSINNPIIQNAVKEAVAEEKNPYWIARKIYRYVQEKMHYELSGGWNIAPTVLKRGSGSCSEYSFVYMAMCRAAGIPTRFAGSIVIRGDDSSYDEIFHRWVEIYLPQYGWIPVDPSGGDEPEPEKQAEFFGGLKNRFLITTIGAGSSEYLGWEYNSSSNYKCTGRCKIMTYKGGRWEPLGKKYESPKEMLYSPVESSSRGCH